MKKHLPDSLRLLTNSGPWKIPLIQEICHTSTQIAASLHLNHRAYFLGDFTPGQAFELPAPANADALKPTSWPSNGFPARKYLSAFFCLVLSFFSKSFFINAVIADSACQGPRQLREINSKPRESANPFINACMHNDNGKRKRCKHKKTIEYNMEAERKYQERFESILRYNEG